MSDPAPRIALVLLGISQVALVVSVILGHRRAQRLARVVGQLSRRITLLELKTIKGRP